MALRIGGSHRRLDATCIRSSGNDQNHAASGLSTIDAINEHGLTGAFLNSLLAALGGTADLKAFEPQQLHDLAYLSLKVHGLGYGASLLFFGFCSIVFGYLIHQSGYLPRILGSLLAIAGAGYVVFSLAQITAPAFTDQYLFPWLLLPAFFAELGLALWLTIKGVNVQKWKERASR